MLQSTAVSCSSRESCGPSVGRANDGKEARSTSDGVHACRGSGAGRGPLSEAWLVQQAACNSCRCIAAHQLVLTLRESSKLALGCRRRGSASSEVTLPLAGAGCAAEAAAQQSAKPTANACCSFMAAAQRRCAQCRVPAQTAGATAALVVAAAAAAAAEPTVRPRPSLQCYRIGQVTGRCRAPEQTQRHGFECAQMRCLGLHSAVKARPKARRGTSNAFVSCRRDMGVQSVFI